LASLHFSSIPTHAQLVEYLWYNASAYIVT